VYDSKLQITGYFKDSSRKCRVADRLEEDVVHHASMLSRCNAANTTMKLLFDGSSIDQLQPSVTAELTSISGSADTFSSS